MLLPPSRRVSAGVDDAKAGDTFEGQATQPPSLTLPKGGGAIRGIGEKFAANPVTGTGSMTVPIATSPGRSGFGPQLSLSYDSGAGNGPFGFGWSLSLPALTRKTDKGLPLYCDAEESDVFILSGAEDLVPELEKDAAGHWVMKDGAHVVHEQPRIVDGVAYTVRRYRPRVEGLFARIERWTSVATGETHWRSITPDNVTTLYGTDNGSRIFDPGDPDPEHPTRIFGWLICASYDDKGNAILYEYAAENDDHVDRSQANERNRVRTANRHLKRILYGNRQPNRDEATWAASHPAELPAETWMFEVVFDYDEAHYEELNPEPPPDQHRFVRTSASVGRPWSVRPDPFSSHRAGFEVRSYRRCRRVLMFHHIPDLPTGEKGYDGLVRSTEFDYADLDYSQLVTIEEELAHPGSTCFASFIRSITQSGYVRDDTQAVVVRDGVPYATYLEKSLPPLEFEYSKASIQDEVLEGDAESLENLPAGLDGSTYRWVDLDGEGLSGILTEQADAWFYKRNLGGGHFGPLETVAAKPSLAVLASGRQQLLDLAGDGQLDLVVLAEPTPGFYERTFDEDWAPFRTFRELPDISWDDPNLRFVDLDGDGHADVLITEQDVFTWYPSLAEEGFGPARKVHQSWDEERGPRLVFADGTESVYLADMCGDGLTDIVRIRNGDVCYWPNLGYCRFGPKVTMDNAPWFDHPDQFDHKRIRLADIDGSGAIDIIYLHRDGVRLYFNQSGNSWSNPQQLKVFPCIDDVVNIVPMDLLGNGTACLVWSSPLAGDARRQLRYVDLMGGTKPHLLVKTVNNLGAETRVDYAPSTKFYLLDKRDGKPWITRLPFPVHVVEKVMIYDHTGRNRFVTRYAYHHGYFDGEEREFRGFGMVEQWDTEELAALIGEIELPAEPSNADPASHLPPVHTKTWFHTGACRVRDRISDFFAGLLNGDDTGEYYREPGLSDNQAKALLLPDTELPVGLTLEEEREACRALKGSMLRQEVYADDAPPGASEAIVARSTIPYSVLEQNLSVRLEQPRAGNRHGVFFAHPREAITYHYERNPADPRTQHVLTLEVDRYGNVLKELAVGYGRRQADPSLPTQADRDKQTRLLLTYTNKAVTKPIDGAAHPDDYRTPLAAETSTYELTGFKPENNAPRFSFDEWTRNGFALLATAAEIPYEQTANHVGPQKRLIERLRTLYRPDELGAGQTDPLALLPLGELERLALTGESCKLAFTPGLLAQVYQRNGQALLPSPAAVLGAQGGEGGGYVDLDGDGHWWIPSGRVFFSLGSDDAPGQELAHARQHFFLPRRYRDPFHTPATSTEARVSYDGYDLLLLETQDALGNHVTVGERLPDGSLDPTKPGNNYRVLQPWRVMDPNRNRSQVAFDTLGLVVGTAVLGKPEETLGDSLDDFVPDLTEAVLLEHLSNPLADPHAVLGHATTRLLYDLGAYERSKHQPDPQPAVVYSLARETHDADLGPGQQTKVQHGFSYSDGFGRQIQKKLQAEPGPLVEDGANVSPRWVGTGWTVFNNKGKPVRQYEPFFSNTHRFEFGVQVGVSPILFYDPRERVVATLHPNDTYAKVVFDPWRQITYDVNDTCAPRNAQTGDPRTDPETAGYVEEYFDSLLATPGQSWQTWYQRRQSGGMGPHEQAAATKAAAHADTPTTAHLDALGRPFLTLAQNRVVCADHPLDGTEDRLATRVELDIEGNQREVSDANDRIVMRYDYEMLGNRVHQASMEAGERWMLNDVMGDPIRAWDSRGHNFVTAYDALRRPVEQTVRGTTADSDPRTLNQDVVVDKIEYGESPASAESLNLRGRTYRHFDSAGVVTTALLDAKGHPTEAYDFKGNPLHGRRQFVRDYKDIPDWSQDPVLLADSFDSHTSYDALNRPIAVTAPDQSVYYVRFNEANLVDKVEVDMRGGGNKTLFVANIDYNAKGQRTLIEFGSQAATARYEYDELTYRLTRLKTTRAPGQNGLSAKIFASASVVQDLAYTYDPAGNITRITEAALRQIVYKGQTVAPASDYVYDAVYRLVQATGREHIGQTALQPAPPPGGNYRDWPYAGAASPNDLQALRNYTQQYEYDAVGNLIEMIHKAVNGGWTRHYDYNEPSRLEPGKQSNRLSETVLSPNANQPIIEPYVHDAHGNMTRMPHLPLIQWDYRDQMIASARQVKKDEPPETTSYVYDAAGHRARKVTERQNGARQNERFYVGGFEMYRKYNGSGESVELERETLHVIGDKQRIALVDTKTIDSSSPLTSHSSLIRYQIGNHLRSASLELDETGQMISHEEYHPYGTTSYQVERSGAEVSPKRYRYTGKEKDEETGFNYHGARYYAAWLGRWASGDPLSASAGTGVYTYAANNPLCAVDPVGLWPEWVDKRVNEAHAAADQLAETATAAKQKIAEITETGKGYIQKGIETGKEIVVGAGKAGVNITLDAIGIGKGIALGQGIGSTATALAKGSRREKVHVAGAAYRASAKVFAPQLAAAQKFVESKYVDKDPTGIALAEAGAELLSVLPGAESGEHLYGANLAAQRRDIAGVTEHMAAATYALQRDVAISVVGPEAIGGAPKPVSTVAPEATVGPRRLTLVERDFLPSKSLPQVVQGVTESAFKKMEANPNLISKYLTPGERKFTGRGPWALRIKFGNAIERAIGSLFEEAQLGEHTGDKTSGQLGGPDIIGRNAYEGERIQITGERSFKEHLVTSPLGTVFGLYQKLKL